MTIIAVVIVLIATFGIWRLYQNKEKPYTFGSEITGSQVEVQIYDTIDQELEEAIANITDEEIEDALLNQIG